MLLLLLELDRRQVPLSACAPIPPRSQAMMSCPRQVLLHQRHNEAHYRLPPRPPPPEHHAPLRSNPATLSVLCCPCSQQQEQRSPAAAAALAAAAAVSMPKGGVLLTLERGSVSCGTVRLLAVLRAASLQRVCELCACRVRSVLEFKFK